MSSSSLSNRAENSGCRLCHGKLDGASIDLGALPACNRYEQDVPTTDTRRLVVVQCPVCRLVQLADDTPVEFIRPRVPWIRYNEPDGHLNDVCDRLIRSLTGGSGSAFGTGPFDRPLLDRLTGCGVSARQLDLLAYAGSHSDGFPYLETLQQCLRPSTLGRAAAGYGERADIVVCRYLLEHSHDPVAALRSLGALATDGGAVVIEVPDSSKFIARRDYSFVWEEHICYFTESTLRALAGAAGLRIEQVARYEGGLEDALVAVLRRSPTGVTSGSPAAESDAFVSFCAAFEGVKRAFQGRLATLTSAGRKVALIGTGHQAIMFVNALGLAPWIAVMVDDDPNKRYRYFPGTSTRIVAVTSLCEDKAISACIIAVNPRAEVKIRERLSSVLDESVNFYALSPGGRTPTLLDQ
jgi:hypothetical protein